MVSLGGAQGVGTGGSAQVRLSREFQSWRASWWAGKAFWALVDQGLFALSNFALGILLARWVSVEQYGSFAVAQSVFLLAGTLHTGLFIEPMLVFGSAKHATRFPVYLEVLLAAHWRVTAVGSLLFAAAALGFELVSSHTLAAALLGVAIAGPLILFSWLMRRACLSRFEPRWSATGGAFYLLVLVAGCLLLRLTRLLSPFSALVLWGVAGLSSGLWIQRRLRAVASGGEGAALSRGEVFDDHWRYGRWAVASSGLSWIPGQLYYILLPSFAGLQAAGTLRAVSNLVVPITHFNEALNSLLLPALASAAPTKTRFHKFLAAGVVVFVGGSLAYGAVLTAFREPVIDWLYHGRYREAAGLVPLMSLIPVAAALSAVLGSALRAREQPRHVFWGYVASSVVTGTAGIWAMLQWGLRGAAGGLLLSSTVTVAMFLLALIRTRERVRCR